MSAEDNTNWDKRRYHGRYNKYPFTDVVAFMMRTFGEYQDRGALRVLDLGCGGAHHLRFLAEEGFDYYGIDGAQEAINIATERLGGLGHRTDNLSVGTFENLPYEDNFFDGLIDRSSIMFNRLDNIPPLIAEARRVLRPGGWLFSMMLNEQSSSKNAARALGNNDFTDMQGRLAGAGVTHYTNAAEARELFSEFHIKNIELSMQSTEYSDDGNSNIVAWTLVTCQKI